MLITNGQTSPVVGTDALTSPFVIHLLLVGSGLVVAVASLLWTLRNRDKHAATEFGLFLGTVVLWAAAQLVEVLGGPGVAYAASFLVEAIRAVMALGWFYFTMTYAGYGSAAHSTTVRLCAAAGTIYLLVFTAFPPVATAVTFETVGVTHTPFAAVALRGTTPFHHLAQLIGYLLVGVGTIALVHRLVETEYTRPWQTVAFLAAVLGVLTFDLLVDDVISPVAGVDYTVVGTSAVSVVYILALYRGDLFGFVPVARDHVFHNMDEGVVVVNPDHKVVDVNAAATSMVGDEVRIGRDAEVVLPDEIATDHRVRNLTGGRTTATISENGTTRHYDLSVSTLGPAAELTGIAIILRDTTERTENERELERIRNRTEFALGATDTLVWDWNADSDRVTFYPSEESLYGREIETWDELADVVHPDDRQQFREAFASSLETRDPIREEFRIVPDGDRRWIETRGKPVDDEAVTRMVGLARDITDRKERRRKLRRQNERLDRFAGVVSHDLRNPLNVAQARLDLAREECDSDHFDAIEQAHERMEQLIQNVLALAREGDSVRETEPVALATAAERSWRNVATAEATLVTETERTIRVDRSRLRQLLENLFRNAIEHGGEDVTITIDDLDAEAGFAVEDDGNGIPEDEHDRVFHPGYSTAETGTGFGLAIVREIARAHDWEISATESAAGGVRFEFRTQP